MPLEITGLTWNLHGKGIQHVSTLMQGLEAPPDIFFLQELGDVRGVAEGASRQDTSLVAGREYQVFLANPHYSHRCCAVLVALDLEFMNPHVHVHEFGVFVRGRMNACAWCLSSLHFPHQQRSDAPDTWEKGISTLLQWVTAEPWDTHILIGHDLNQDLHAEFDEFAGMLHYREFVFQTGLQTSPPLGDTWMSRGSSSAIDFYLHQIRGAELRFVNREDLRISLPSDHNAIQVHCSFRGKRVTARQIRPPRTLCGKWTVDVNQLWEELSDKDVWDNDCVNQAFRAPQVSKRPQSLRYVDPPPVKALIDRRKATQDSWLKCALMQEIHQLRVDAKAAHKEYLLQEARQGNYRAIAHMRASASGGQTEGSYVHRAGGRTQAAEKLFSFYEDKYSAPADLVPTPHQVRCLEDKHGGQPSVAVTTEEILLALHKCKTGVSAGMDGATYEGLKYVIAQDKQDRMAKYFTELIRQPQRIPAMWKSGKIVLLPKVARPAEPKDLRPICLTPVLCRLFAKVLMKRVHRTAPEHSGHQIGCRQGVQTMDGVLASQSAMQLLKQSRGAAYTAKIDIKAAFDSLARTAVLKWLHDCSPSAECLALYRLLDDTCVQLSMAGESRTIRLQRGIMQGTSYSADVFSRVMDYFLAPLHDRFDADDPAWNSPDLGLPHFIIYADDVILFADSPQSLQHKLQAMIDVLKTIGLVANPSKSRVMALHDGSHPGIWIRGRAEPLQVEASLQFLGVPLSHSPNPQGVMTHLMRRTSNAYYGFKRLMDSGRAPVSTRLLIFSTFITGKWAWAAPAMIPNKLALRKLEGSKNTFLLSLFRLPTDPLLTWIENTVSRRRAIKVICRQNRGPDWREVWLTRIWSYLGHLARTPYRQPMKRILLACTRDRINPSDIKPSWVTDLLIRRVQRIYEHWDWASEWPSWELMAKDRVQWSSHARTWVRHWTMSDSEGVATFEYLYDRQLILLQGKKALLECFFRPAKDFTDTPYTTPLHVIKPAKLGGPILWTKVWQDQCMVVFQDGRSLEHTFCVQTKAVNDTPQAQSATALRLAFKLHAILEHHSVLARVLMPQTCLNRSVMHNQVPLNLLSEATEALNIMDRQGVQCLYLPPNPHKTRDSPWAAQVKAIEFVPQHTKYLLRDPTFTVAFFCEGAQQLSDAVTRCLR